MEGKCSYCCIKLKEEEVVGVEKSFIGKNALVGRQKPKSKLATDCLYIALQL